MKMKFDAIGCALGFTLFLIAAIVGAVVIICLMAQL
jgi:hypothetical protein